MLYGINWNTGSKKQVAQKSNKKKTTTKNYIVEVKKRPDPKKWQQIDAMREKSQFDISDYGNVGKMLVYHIENDILGWRLYVKKTAETMKKFPEIEKVSGISKVKSNAQDLKLGALLIKQGKITKMPMPTLAKAIKRWHESGMQTKMEDFINNDMQKNSTAYKAKTKKKKAKKATTKNLKKQAKKKAKKKAKKVVSKKKIATKTRPAKKKNSKKVVVKKKSQKRKKKR